MNNRKKRLEIANETVQVIENKLYHNKHGEETSIASELDEARVNTILIKPGELQEILKTSPRQTEKSSITVSNETSLSAAKSLVKEKQESVLCLNFASAKNPGGGFLGGSQAQEECLARASGLYDSLLQAQEYYDDNRANNSALYTDHFIYSKNVPVFRNDNDEFLDKPYKVSFLTAPAPNKGAILKNNPKEIGKVEEVMSRRIHGVFALAEKFGYKNLVLGAWGCGVFRNDPNDVARIFSNYLSGDSALYAKSFSHVHFAVLDGTENLKTYMAFENVFNQ